MNPREIFAAMQRVALIDRPGTSDRALLSLRELVVGFLDATAATTTDGTLSMRAMSLDQIRFLNQLHVAVGL
jgi:hypothetical protein